jgi:hypothetical protein
MVQAVLNQILPQVVVLLLHAKVDGLPHARHTSGFISRSQGRAVQVVLQLVFHGMIDGWQVVHYNWYWMAWSKDGRSYMTVWSTWCTSSVCYRNKVYIDLCCTWCTSSVCYRNKVYIDLWSTWCTSSVCYQNKVYIDLCCTWCTSSVCCKSRDRAWRPFPILPSTNTISGYSLSLSHRARAVSRR